MQSYMRRFRQTNPITISPFYAIRNDILLENYDRAEEALRTYLESPRADEFADAQWLHTIALRNQGRTNEAIRLANSHPAPQDLNLATAALDGGKPTLAVPEIRERADADASYMSRTLLARHRTWNYTLLGMALLATGDTAKVRQLTDSVEYWGRHSLYGRDQRAHHYLRGMLLVAQKKDNEAVTHLRAAIHSPTHGFTRVNYELGRTLVRLNRPAEAIPIVRSGLHGDIDGSNLYVTRTDLHELLAQAFDGIGQRDSAAFHYRAVLSAWKRADPAFHARRSAASARLTAFRPGP
jgi:predicted Zn-dependent protease